MSGVNNTIDCRSEEGVTIGLIDAIISICHILSTRSLLHPGVHEALHDLNSDKDFKDLISF